MEKEMEKESPSWRRRQLFGAVDLLLVIYRCSVYATVPFFNLYFIFCGFERDRLNTESEQNK